MSGIQCTEAPGWWVLGLGCWRSVCDEPASLGAAVHTIFDPRSSAIALEAPAAPVDPSHARERLEPLQLEAESDSLLSKRRRGAALCSRSARELMLRDCQATADLELRAATDALQKALRNAAASPTPGSVGLAAGEGAIGLSGQSSSKKARREKEARDAEAERLQRERKEREKAPLLPRVEIALQAREHARLRPSATGRRRPPPPEPQIALSAYSALAPPLRRLRASRLGTRGLWWRRQPATPRCD